MTVFGHLWKLERRASIHLCLQHPATAVPVTGLSSQRFQILSLIDYLLPTGTIDFQNGFVSREEINLCADHACHYVSFRYYLFLL